MRAGWLLLSTAAARAAGAPCTPCDTGGPCAACEACANQPRDASCAGCTGGTCAWCWEPHSELPNDGKPCLGPKREYCCKCWNLAARGTCSSVVPPPAPAPPAPPTPPGPAPPTPPGPAPPPPPPASGCIKDASAGLHENVSCGAHLSGLKMTYNIPAKCVTGGCGLIFDVHGYSMSALQEDANTDMRRRGEENGYIVVQPTAPGGNWLPVTAAKETAMLSWMEEAKAAWKVDTNKLHFMGFSQGAMFTAHMICDHPDAFASFTVMEAANDAPTLTCLKSGAPQPPVLIQNGLYDQSSQNANMAKSLPHIKSAWQLGEGKVIAGALDGDFYRMQFKGPAGTPFEFLNHTYVADYFLKGHCFPGSDDLVQKWLAGPYGCPGKKEQAKGRKAGYVIGDEAMKFFLAHPKPK